jgi:hypothetical protein
MAFATAIGGISPSQKTASSGLLMSIAPSGGQFPDPLDLLPDPLDPPPVPVFGRCIVVSTHFVSRGCASPPGRRSLNESCDIGTGNGPAEIRTSRTVGLRASHSACAPRTLRTASGGKLVNRELHVAGVGNRPPPPSECRGGNESRLMGQRPGLARPKSLGTGQRSQRVNA